MASVKCRRPPMLALLVTAHTNGILSLPIVISLLLVLSIVVVSQPEWIYLDITNYLDIVTIRHVKITESPL
jgi:hypothetical protein